MEKLRNCVGNLKSHKYDNPDPRCNHPRGDSTDYCWSYAHHVDGTEGFEDMLSHCVHCEFFSEHNEHTIHSLWNRKDCEGCKAMGVAHLPDPVFEPNEEKET